MQGRGPLRAGAATVVARFARRKPSARQPFSIARARAGRGDERPAAIQHSALSMQHSALPPPPRDHLPSGRVASEELHDEARLVAVLSVQSFVHRLDSTTPRHELEPCSIPRQGRRIKTRAPPPGRRGRRVLMRGALVPPGQRPFAFLADGSGPLGRSPGGPRARSGMSACKVEAPDPSLSAPFASPCRASATPTPLLDTAPPRPTSAPFASC